MPNSISLGTAIEKAKIDGQAAFLVLLDITVTDPNTGALVDTLRLARNSEEVTYNGNVYVPTVFDIEFQQQTGTQSQVTLTLTETSGAIQAYLEEYNGAVGFGVVMTIVNSQLLVAEIVEYFQIIGASAQDWTYAFTLGAENEVLRIFPRRRQTRDYCQWRYKDPDTCQYTGALPTCDLSLLGDNGCKAHSNTINFGGFPGISGNNFSYA